MANAMSNHFYIDGDFKEFFESSVILNSSRSTDKIIKRENFLFLAAYGYYLGFKTPLRNLNSKKHDTFVMNQLGPEELALVYAIAIADSEDVEIVNNDIKVAEILMQYANTGIIELKKIEENTQKGNEIKKFQVIIKDYVDELKG